MRLLVIEDDATLRQSLAAKLEDGGFAVEQAGDGKEGLYFALEYTIDLAIVDLGLPEMSGLDIIREVRRQGKAYPILILTARDRWEDKVDGLNVTDNQSSVMRISSLAICRLILDRGGEPILQLTCRDRNRVALKSDGLGAAALGDIGSHFPDTEPVWRGADSLDLLGRAAAGRRAVLGMMPCHRLGQLPHSHGRALARQPDFPVPSGAAGPSRVRRSQSPSVPAKCNAC